MADPGELSSLLPFAATEYQRRTVELLIQHGNSETVAKEMGVRSSVVRDTATKLRKKAARHGWAPPAQVVRTRSVVPPVTVPGRKHLVLPDTQVEPGVPLDHFIWIARYAAAKGPDVIIHLGDHWDMPSLSSYDNDRRRAFERRDLGEDIASGNRALEMMHEEWARLGYTPPRRVLLEGNHDGFAPGGRVGRYLADGPRERSLVTPDKFADSWLGWERVPFLSNIDIDGILYSHLFPVNLKGQFTGPAQRQGASSADIQIRGMMRSTTAGHRQGLDVKIHPSAPLRGVIAGSCYLHNPEYLGPTQNYWRGILVKHDVGPHNPHHYDLLEVSLSFLQRKYS